MIAKRTNTPEEMKSSPARHYTVGELKKYIEEYNIPDDALVLIQRIEDVYFEENNWGTVKKEGWMYTNNKQLIERAKPGGEYHDKEKYPEMTDEHIKGILEMEDELPELQEEYISVFSPVKYKDDNNLYLDAHY